MRHFYGKTRYVVNIAMFFIQTSMWALNALFSYYVVCVNDDSPGKAVFSFSQTSWLNVINCIGMMLGLSMAVKLHNVFGFKRVFQAYVALGIIASLVFVAFAGLGFPAMAVLVFIVGISVSNAMVILAACVNNWSTVHELGIFTGLMMASYDLPIIVAGFYSGGICATSLGWRGMYPLFAGIAAVFFIIFEIVYTDSPAQNRFVSDKELLYITTNQFTVAEDKPQKVPYRKFFTDLPVVIGVLIGSPVFVSWFVTMVCAPSFMNVVYKESPFEIGLLSSLGFAISVVIKLVCPSIDVFIPLSERTKFYIYGALFWVASTTYFIMMSFIHKDALWIAVVANIINGGMGFGAMSFNKSEQTMCQQHVHFFGAVGIMVYYVTGIILSTITSFFVNLDSAETFVIMFRITGVFNFLAIGAQMLTFTTEPRPFTRISSSDK